MGLGIALGAISIGANLLGGSSAKEKAKKLGKAQARLERQTTAEELRRMDRDFDQLQGQAYAAIGASGIKSDGSSEAVVKDMESEFARQKEWTELSGELRADVARRGGQAASDRIGYQAAQGVISGANIIGRSEGWWK